MRSGNYIFRNVYFLKKCFLLQRILVLNVVNKVKSKKIELLFIKNTDAS